MARKRVSWCRANSLATSISQLMTMARIDWSMKLAPCWAEWLSRHCGSGLTWHSMAHSFLHRQQAQSPPQSHARRLVCGWRQYDGWRVGMADL